MINDPLLGQTIGNYEILGRVGKGGMATVYRARQVNMQRDVAIKIMSADLAEDPQFVARFEREARMIASLQHPRILPVHDFGHEGELFYFVMRLVEGESLYHRLLQGPLPLRTASKYLGQIAEALDYAHAEGVVHRDLKPNNVLIDAWDNLYLMDFGLAKMLAATQSLTQTGTVLGTPAYMAPEQWRGGAVDSRTDVYALGVILYEMVLGRTPFESDTPFTLMYKHINEAPPPLRESLPDLPQAVEDVIFKALAKDQTARYPSAGELAQAFADVVRVAGSLVAKQRLDASLTKTEAPPPSASEEAEPEPVAAAESIETGEAAEAEPVAVAESIETGEADEEAEAEPIAVAESIETSEADEEAEAEPIAAEEIVEVDEEAEAERALAEIAEPLAEAPLAVEPVDQTVEEPEAAVEDQAPIEEIGGVMAGAFAVDGAVLPPDEIIPPPPRIAPPPPPIPLPERSARGLGEFEMPEGTPARRPTAPRQKSRAPARRSRARRPEPPPSGVGELMERVASAPALHQVLDVVDQSVEAAVEKVALSVTPPASSPRLGATAPRSAVPINAPAFERVRQLLPPEEPVVGVLDVRGTPQWHIWKRLLVGGVALFMIGAMLGAGFLTLLGIGMLAYLGFEGYRTGRGDIGRFYLGFTPEQVLLLPRDSDNLPRPDEAYLVAWSEIERLRLSGRYTLLDFPLDDGKTLHFAALLTAMGDGGLGDQPGWLPNSPITALVHERGFEVRDA
jgi:predicted Ser/Thr protein kinase